MGQPQQSTPPMNRAPPQNSFQAKPAMNQNWNETLNKDKAAQASNAEDFTKQFMSQMYGGQSQQNQQQQSNLQQNIRMQARQPAGMPQMSSQPQQSPQQAPVQQQMKQPQQPQWNETLNKDKAGQATNAEDFTKQFMSQMYGGQPQTTQQTSMQQTNRTFQQSTFQQKPGQVL